MTLVRWDPFAAVPFPAVSFPGFDRGPRTGFAPAVEVTREGRDAVITVELPGADVESDVSVEVANGRLAVSGRREDRSEQSTARTVVRERRYGAFRRQFALPEHVSADDVTASYEQGLLRIHVRNVAKELPEPRKIVIQRPATQPTAEGESEDTTKDTEAAAA